MSMVLLRFENLHGAGSELLEPFGVTLRTDDGSVVHGDGKLGFDHSSGFTGFLRCHYICSANR